MEHKHLMDLMVRAHMAEEQKREEARRRKNREDVLRSARDNCVRGRTKNQSHNLKWGYKQQGEADGKTRQEQQGEAND